MTTLKIDQLISSLSAKGIELFFKDGRLLYRAPEGRVTENLRSILTNHRGHLIAHLSGNRKPSCEQIENFVLEAGGSKRCSASYAQERLWVLAQLAAVGSAYNIPVAVRL